jgi:hypothetical protein
MRSALFIPILLMLVGIGLSFWGIWGVSTAYGDLSEGHEVAKEGVMARDWDQANRGVSTLFVAIKSLGISETIEDLGLIVTAVSALASFLIYRRVARGRIVQGANT